MIIRKKVQIARRFGLRIRLFWETRILQHSNPIIVYQMGKVGSSTVVRTLANLSLTVPQYHVHTLDVSGLARAVEKERHFTGRISPIHLEVSSRLIRVLRKGVFPCRIITLTREPVSRAISHVFEDLRKQAPDGVRADGSLNTDRIAASIDRLLNSTNGIASPTIWFDSELKKNIGIDVFESQYERDRGFATFSTGSVSALAIRMEDLNHSLPGALGAFLGVQPSAIALSCDNVGSSKWYASAMADIKSNYRIARSDLARILDTKYARHFYSDERDELMKRWS